MFLQEHKKKSCYNPLRLGTVIVLVSSSRLCKYSTFVKRPSHPLRKIANLALWFVPEGDQSAWALQETHRNSINYAQDEARTSECLLDQQMP